MRRQNTQELGLHRPVNQLLYTYLQQRRQWIKKISGLARLIMLKLKIRLKNQISLSFWFE